MDIAALYDRHAPRMYALALRITHDPGRASAVIERVFGVLLSEPAAAMPRDAAIESWLIRAVRSEALRARDDQTPASPVSPVMASGRAMLDAIFLDGITPAELASAASIPAEEIRQRLVEGMAALRAKVRSRVR